MVRFVNICDVCTDIFAGGDAPKGRISQMRTEDYSVPIYSNGEENSGLYGFTDSARVTEPSITISARGTIGYTAIRTEPFVPIVRLITLIPKQNDIDIKYLYYAVQNYKFTGSGTSIPQLTVPMLKQYGFPLPDREVQQHTVRILDKICDLISLRKQQLAKLDELVKSRFIELFGDPISNPLGWPVKRLADLSVLITNGNTPKGGSENYVNEGIMFLRSQNVWRNRIDLDDVAYIDIDTHADMAKSSVHDKDILITKTGRINTENSSLGRAALFRGADNSANINGHVYLVRLDGTVVPEYVVAILTGEPYRRYIRKVCVGGIDKRQINLDQVENFPIILPPIELQEQFAAFVEQTDKSKLTIQQSLDKLELLKKALMQEYFG